MHLIEIACSLPWQKSFAAFNIRPRLGPEGKEEAGRYIRHRVTIHGKYLAFSNALSSSKRGPGGRVDGKEWEQSLRTGYYLGNVKVNALGMVN